VTAFRGPLTALASVVAAFGLVACGDGPGSSGPPTLRIVTYSSYVIDPEVQRSVEERLGVRLELRAAGDAGEMLAKAALSAGRPEGDVIVGIDNTLMGRALAADLLEPYRPAALGAVPDELRLDDSGRLTPVDWGSVCVDADRQWFADRELELPPDLDDLLDPRYRGLLVVPSPVTSSPGLVFLAAVHATRPDPEAYLERLRENDVAVVGSWDDAWYQRYTVSGGDRPLVVSYASSPPAEVHFSEGALSEPRSVVLEATCARQVEFAGVLRGTDQPQLARRLVDEMLGEEWQASLPLANFVEPARADVARPELFERFAPRPADPVEIDPEAVDVGRDRWIEQWRTVME